MLPSTNQHESWPISIKYSTIQYNTIQCKICQPRHTLIGDKKRIAFGEITPSTRPRKSGLNLAVQMRFKAYPTRPTRFFLWNEDWWRSHYLRHRDIFAAEEIYKRTHLGISSISQSVSYTQNNDKLTQDNKRRKNLATKNIVIKQAQKESLPHSWWTWCVKHPESASTLLLPPNWMLIRIFSNLFRWPTELDKLWPHSVQLYLHAVTSKEVNALALTPLRSDGQQVDLIHVWFILKLCKWNASSLTHFCQCMSFPILTPMKAH